MSRRLGRVLVFQVLLAGIVAGSACNKTKKDDAFSERFGEGGGPPPGMFGGGPGGPPRGPIGEAMTKLFKGPQSLKDSIGRELNSESPPWETLRPQAKAFAQLVSSLSKYDPHKGSKDSWTKLTGSFSKQAADLERAVNAKDHDAALAAHAAVSDTQSCSTCHQAHRGGPGGMRMPPGGFRGRGGPPGGSPAQPQ